MSAPQPSNPRAQADHVIRQRFGERLRELRLERHVNQDELAHRAGLHRSHIGLLENGKRDAQLTTVFRLASALEVPPSQLLDFTVDLHENTEG